MGACQQMMMSYGPLAAPGGGFSTPVSFTDNFNDGSKSGDWAATTIASGWESTAAAGGTATEASGVLTLSGFTPSTYEFNGYSSNSAIAVTAGQSVWLKVAMTGNIACSVGFFDSAAPTSRFVRIQVDNFNSISNAANNNAGSGGTFWGPTGSVPYSATDHAWIAIKNTGSQFEAYTAPDSAGSPGTGVLRGTTSAGWWNPTSVRVWIGGVVNSASPGSAVLDGFCTNT